MNKRVVNLNTIASLVEAGKGCDDANAVNGDGCLVSCQRPASWVSSDVHAHTTGLREVFWEERGADLETSKAWDRTAGESTR